jgi:threonine synthase
MLKYVSTKGSSSPVDFKGAILQGFAEDGGLFVPETVPKISRQRLAELSKLSYSALAFEILSPFISKDMISGTDLKQLMKKSFAPFRHPDAMPMIPIDKDGMLYSMELFHGPTLSFKDIAMGFLINMMDYFLQKEKSHLSIIVATTGDTGPAVAYAAAGKATIDCWLLYPDKMISEEQKRQMTTLGAENIHPVAVRNCKNGGDDLDRVVATLFSTRKMKAQSNLSSVNSINWGRVMAQTIHYAYGYFKACDAIGDPVDFCVPSGAFGNLFAGYLARKMGIPIHTFICANNQNKTLHTAFSTGRFKKEDLCPTLSTAIDIVIPYNFWRFLYFSCGSDPVRLNQWMTEFEKNGEIHFDKKTHEIIKKGFVSFSVSDEMTLATIRQTWKTRRYLLDPHSAVAVSAAKTFQSNSNHPKKIVCLATAHPAKFPDVVQKALSPVSSLPDEAFHPSLLIAKKMEEQTHVCDLAQLEEVLINDIKKN